MGGGCVLIWVPPGSWEHPSKSPTPFFQLDYMWRRTLFLFSSLVGEMLAILVADTLASYLGMSGRWSELFGIAEEEACLTRYFGIESVSGCDLLRRKRFSLIAGDTCG